MIPAAGSPAHRDGPSGTKTPVWCDVPGLAFPSYPAAVKAGGLIFASAVRGAGAGLGFADLPAEGRGKEQGFPGIDGGEGEVAASSWHAHAALEAVLGAAGADTDQILRQHVWQKDKRYFPVYEAVRKHWQPTPAPSSGLGVRDLGAVGGPWIGLDAIAVEKGAHPVFTNRAVVAAVDHRALPSASHYSQAVRTGPLVFTAGHIPIKTSEPGKPVVSGFDDVAQEGRFLATGRSHPDSRDGPIAAQAFFVYDELRKLLAHAELTLADTVLSTVYLADLRDLAVFHRVHRHFFPDGGPALAISGFDEVGHRGCRIEIELTALDPRAGLSRAPIPWTHRAPVAAPAGMRAGDFVFLSGIAGWTEEARIVRSSADLAGGAATMVARIEAGERVPGLAAQTYCAFARLGETLAAAGGGLRDLVKLTVYLGSAADYPVFEALAAQLLPRDALPAFECVVIHGPGPAPDCHVQLEAIAHISAPTPA